MKKITVSIDDETYRLVNVRAAEVGTTVAELVQEFLAEYCRIEDVAARQVFMQWLRDDAQSAQDPRSADPSSRLHIYR